MKIVGFLYRIILLFSILWGAHAWFTWWIEAIPYASQASMVLIAAIALLYRIRMRLPLRKDPSVFVIFILWMLAFLSAYEISFAMLLGIIIRFIPLWILISDKNCSDHLQWIKKYIAILLFPGLIIHILYIISPFPSIPIQYGNSMTYIFYNYIFNIEVMSPWIETSYRFQSVFLEPGYLGTLLCFLLYADRYNFKDKYTKILLIALVFSFSLAGYIISFMGYLLYKRNVGINFTRIVGVFVLLIAFCLVASTYKNGDNVFNERIISRLRFDKEKGIQGNNRNGYTTDYYFNRVLTSDKIFFGLSNEEISQINGDDDGYADEENKLHGAGFKLFVVVYGILPVLFYFLFYLLTASQCGYHRRYSLGFFFLILLTFIQASYPNSFCWLIPFILGINNRTPLQRRQ